MPSTAIDLEAIEGYLLRGNYPADYNFKGPEDEPTTTLPKQFQDPRWSATVQKGYSDQSGPAG